MKKLLCVLMLLAAITCSVNGAVTIAKDTVVVVGGLGTQADNATTNGGGATKTAWDAGSPSDFIDVNGGPKSADTAITFDFAGGTPDRKFSKAGIGTNVTVGTLAFVSGTNITTGIYEITSIAGDDSWVACADIVATDDNADSVMNIGGAIDSLQQALDDNDAASQNRFIYDNIATETIAATIDIDIFSGSVSTRVFVIGYNATLAAETEVIITTTDTLVNGLLHITTQDRLEFWHIDFDGGGKDAARAAFGVNAGAAGDGQFSTFYDCKFHGASSDGASYRGSGVSFMGCEFFLNGRYGYNTAGSINDMKFYGNSVHDNDDNGVHWRPVNCTVLNNLYYDNGKDGSGHGINHSGAVVSNVYINNTIHGNATDGISMDSSDSANAYLNNTSVANGAFGYDLQGLAEGDFAFFGFNHASVNTTAHYSVGADNTFAAFRNGSNKADTTSAANLFTSVADGSEDFTPKAATDLIDNALDAGTV